MPQEDRRTRLHRLIQQQPSSSSSLTISGSTDMERWVQSAKKVKILERDTLIDREAKEIVFTEAINSLRDLQNHIAATDWMFSDE